MKHLPIDSPRRACLLPNASTIAVGALSSGWRLVNWRSLIETVTADPAALPTNPDSGQAGPQGVIFPGENQQIVMQFNDESFQDDLLQGIRRS
jgi:hypothetical protein